MQQIEGGRDKFYISDDVYWKYFEDNPAANFILWLATLGIKRTHFNSLIAIYGELHNRDKRVFLHAHGDFVADNWCFSDMGVLTPVQEWVDSIDGEAAVIGILACNPENSQISSKKSLVIHSVSNVRGLSLIFGTNLRLFMPGERYIENDRRKIKELQNRLLLKH